ncbi:tRNA epoxyqueuosine(34) reductase QueG [Chromatium okenii]|uniref:tRNA epoxyqueuosine(34) reductase QueG n=1 Tax=Chromatium okenii TaxID=61644 RepID=UPI0019072DEE|nr:tRNA epoxyqueuosine(34) reductase QueG [Chromatium okenii]MBK1642432.1 tRNA epoxyqueuosine(34) reductase QueG [Chromatium okenii]
MILTTTQAQQLATQIKYWGQQLGFQQLGITDTDLTVAEMRLQQWLAAGQHGTMDYLARHGTRRSRPAELVPGTQRVIVARMDYFTAPSPVNTQKTTDSIHAFIASYALGRDYHRVLRQRLQRLATQIESAVGAFGYRVFVDSAPVLEKPLAVKAGLGWMGKNTNLIHPQAGSWFFLGEIYTDLPLPIDSEIPNHCGNCQSCLTHCPTGAIIAPYQLDARRCISYLTIEYRGSIPLDLRPLLGNRIYGCDECQRCCPWNRFATITAEADFQVRHSLNTANLIELFAWNEATFLQRTEGSAIRRIGYQQWLRNIAVALGNVPPHPEIITALYSRLTACDDSLVREHIEWSIQHLTATASL